MSELQQQGMTAWRFQTITFGTKPQAKKSWGVKIFFLWFWLKEMSKFDKLGEKGWAWTRHLASRCCSIPKVRFYKSLDANHTEGCHECSFARPQDAGMESYSTNLWQSLLASGKAILCRLKMLDGVSWWKKLTESSEVHFDYKTNMMNSSFN